eukprot:776476_1
MNEAGEKVTAEPAEKNAISITVDENGKNAIEASAGSSGRLGSIFNLTNSILGGATMSMACCMAEGGLFFGLFLVAVVALVTEYMFNLVIVCGKKVDESTYEGLATHVLNRTGWYAINVSILWVCIIGAMTGYLQLVGANVSSLVAGEYILGIESRVFWIVLISTLIVLPLSLSRHIKALEKISGFSIVGMALVVVLIMV